MADLPDYYTAAQLVLAEVSAIIGGLDDDKSEDPSVKDVYLATDTNRLYICFADGEWTDVTGLFLRLAGGAMTGEIAMGTNKITGLGDPTLAQDAATRVYVLGRIAALIGDHAGLAAAHHAKYTDGEAVDAVEAAGLALAKGKSVKVISALTDDGTFAGLTAAMTAGTDLLIGQAVYVGGDSKMEKAFATGAATMPAIALATWSIDENDEGEFLLQGFLRYNTWDWTPGGLLYVSREFAGLLTQTLPALTGEQVQVVGVAITADIIHFNPSYELVEIS